MAQREDTDALSRGTARAGGAPTPGSDRASDRDTDDVTVAAVSPGSEDDGADVPGTVLGRYVVIEHVGSGGMGSVVRAYDPRLRREVAVKRLRANRRDKDAQRRLMREARAMARLSHPNVVAVYDVEAHGDAVVLAMEYVAGTTLRGWLDRRPRDFARIVEIFGLAGRGLAAAHRAELVHRDFKPTNVLVSDDADDAPLVPLPVGAVKVTDFGLAKPAASSSGSEPPEAAEMQDDALTRAGTVMGTPRYMAPEQHTGAIADARADQYAYCVALWEALCDKPPFRGKSLQELAKAKLTGPPVWSRKDVPRSIGAVLRRGLEPDPAARWPSMDALLAQLDRWRGQARRKRAAWLLGVTAALGAGAFGLHVLQRQRIVSSCNAAGAEVETMWPARRSTVLEGVRRSGVPYAEATAAKITPALDAWSQRWTVARIQVCRASELDAELDEELGAKARACLTHARIRTETLLGSLQRGEPSAVQGAVAAVSAPAELSDCTDENTLRQTPWPEPTQLEQVASLRERLARASGMQLAGLYDEGQQEARAVLDAAEQLAFVPLVVETRLRLGTLLELRAEYEDAERELRAAYFEAAKQGLDRLALDAASRLVFTVGLRLSRPDDGVQWGEHAQIFAARLQESAPLLHANLWNNLAAAHRAAGHHREARELHERALRIREAVLGLEHPDVATSISNLALVVADEGKYEEAKGLHEYALELRERALGPKHPHVASSLDNIAGVSRALGEHEHAAALLRRALPIWERNLGPDHPNVATCLSVLTVVLSAMGKDDEAVAAGERALAIRERALGPDDPDVAMSLDALAPLRWSAGRREESRMMRARALEIREATFGADHFAVAHSLNNLASVEALLGERELAARHYERAIAVWERDRGPRFHLLVHPLVGLAELRLEQGRAEQAAGLARRALEIQEQRSNPPLQQTARARFVLARVAWNRGEEASALEEATRARDAARASGEADELLADVESWIDERPPAAGGR